MSRSKELDSKQTIVTWLEETLKKLKEELVNEALNSLKDLSKEEQDGINKGIRKMASNS